MDALVCGDCGTPLEVICPKGHSVTDDTVQRANGYEAGARGRTFRPKPCARCRRDFQPTGPRSSYCGRPDCVEN